MDGYGSDKTYGSYKIPDRLHVPEDGDKQAWPQIKTNAPSSLPDGMFYEIEYDPSGIPGVGKFVLKSQKIEAPEKDEIKDIFHQMRDIARAHRSALDYARFFDRRFQTGSGVIFYKQGMFMKDFTDDYALSTPFSSYFPYYQMMGYEQLRTYFTWRTEVRKGNVADTSLSYAFLYIYELINNIGVSDPEDGLNKLMSFWKAFGAYNKTVDRYILRWLKDYHICYELPLSFKEFVDKNGLAAHYPKLADTNDNFDLFCAVSKYDIRKSAFFTEENAKLVTDCFYFVTDRLRQVCTENGIHFDESVFQPAKKLTVWTPFKDALFYPWMQQKDRRIVLSESEIYICKQNQWAFSQVPATESGRQLIGYMMKQMESVLRKLTKYKHKLSANLDSFTHELNGQLNGVGLSLDRIVSDAAVAFYREATKTVVKVDRESLSKIRQEALITQEKLTVPEPEGPFVPVIKPLNLSLPAMENIPPMPEPACGNDVWESFKNALNETERKALSAALCSEAEIKKFAGACGIMPEVLFDGINEKAMDFIGDSLTDESFALYDDYKEQVRELVG
ncbi:MAG TPA: TerB N-terminal domain-containing protein [Clostridia bacterium]|nr:TerB N-terminal domain-containing protein [Clostridia bacterium]